MNRTTKRFASTIAIAFLISVGSLFQTIQTAQALDLSKLTDDQWDTYSGDNTRFDGIVWGSGNCRETQDERSKTPSEISQLYTNLSTAVLGRRYTMTAGYLYDASYYCGVGRKWHSGIDFGAPAGISVKALGSGTVDWVDINNASANGVFIAVNDDKDGKQWIYGHLQNSGNFRKGSRVTLGQVIGQVGSQSQANHIHLEVRTSPFSTATKTNQDSVRKTTMSPLQAYWLKSNNGNNPTPPLTTAIPFQQPNVSSSLKITVPTVDLTVTASNLSGKTVYVQMWRPAINGNPPKEWNTQKDVTGTSITFNDLEGLGNTFSGVDYYTVASLSPIPPGEAAQQRKSCYMATNRTSRLSRLN